MNGSSLRSGVLSALAFFFSISACHGQSDPLSRDSIQADLADAPCQDQARLEAVKALFMKMGATEADISIVKYKKVEDVVLQIPGQGAGKVVFGAHYDKVKSGCGAIDNWSGVVILTHLYGALRTTTPAKTLIFAAFGREELGLVGSRAMADSIPTKERADYCAMINFDSFGLGIPQVLENASSAKLERFVRTLAKEVHIQYASGPAPGSSDSAPFRQKGIPAITLHGLSNEYAKALHSSEDVPERINLASVWLGFRLAFPLALKLDSCECAAFR
jgi:Iap family predicted aminopeptidase